LPPPAFEDVVEASVGLLTDEAGTGGDFAFEVGGVVVLLGIVPRTEGTLRVELFSFSDFTLLMGLGVTTALL